ncbi:hypothetical protein QQS21_009770 [Conoideocrella luteorostrata]|uniref:Transcription factor domain-containing protein n=1 Tax=Conoideocrella luteorostrata TaxID=1105319 RepID=A0AAJ0CGL3_9HYPO|nr:hypothetical protein QQS21_009770 [Conoideocrella luteorostrata]
MAMTTGQGAMWHVSVAAIRKCGADPVRFPANPASDVPSFKSHVWLTSLTRESPNEEQLEQELQSIRQVVQPSGNGAPAVWTPPSPRAAVSALPDQRPGSGVGVTATATTPQVPTPQAESSAGHRSAQGSEQRLKTGPTEARILGNHIVSGEDIDWYFAKYLQHFHHYIPVLRKKDPDECYEANTTLFWLVIYVASRRYCRDRSLFLLLSEHLEKDIWTMISVTALNFDAVHAMLIMCTFPMPTIRFVTDPSPTLAAIALNTALGLGCHTGQGKNAQFLVGLRQHFQATDEEASATWLACCLLAQRTASAIGIPPPSVQYSDTKTKAALESSLWADLIMMHDIQRLLNRFSNAMYTQITAHGGVHEFEVAMWETEFESLKPLISRYDSEIQLGYFMSPPNTPIPSIKTHAVRVFNTARSIIAHSLDLETRTQFLTHAPQWAMRTNIDAACIIISILHSECAPGMSEPDAHVLVQQACGCVLRSSVRDADLAHRASIIMDTFWSIRNIASSLGPCPGSRTDRLTAGVTFWCLNMFRAALKDAQSSTDRVNKALELMQARACPTTQTQPNPAVKPQTGALNSDPIQEVDWSMFMDDFGWVGDDAGILGLP